MVSSFQHNDVWKKRNKDSVPKFDDNLLIMSKNFFYLNLIIVNAISFSARKKNGSERYILDWSVISFKIIIKTSALLFFGHKSHRHHLFCLLKHVIDATRITKLFIQYYRVSRCSQLCTAQLVNAHYLSSKNT